MTCQDLRSIQSEMSTSAATGKTHLRGDFPGRGIDMRHQSARAVRPLGADDERVAW